MNKLIHCKNPEQGVLDQLELLEKVDVFKGLIAIMPDTHVGVGCVIGFTGQFRNAVIPNLIGVDIGCGVITYNIGNQNIDFAELDKYIRANIPLGKNSRQRNDKWTGDLRYDESLENKFYIDNGIKRFTDANSQLGSLGGGNHFIEIDKDRETGDHYITIHSGSRNFGKQVADFYQKKAKLLCSEMGLDVPQGLEYLPNSFGGKEYKQYMRIAQEYASNNRLLMLKIILDYFKLEFDDTNLIESVHNFIGSDNIIRKGAIQAYKETRVVIPFNMRDGIIIGRGKSNDRYNYSAPHGSGRRKGRKEIMRSYDEEGLANFEKAMAGIYSTSISKDTFDENPNAYKDTNEVLEFIRETVEIEKWLKPVYNLKASE